MTSDVTTVEVKHWEKTEAGDVIGFVKRNYSVRLPAGASFDTETYDQDHTPLPCQVCGNPTAFVGYASKLGKDGRPSKWPVYEVCTNMDSHPTKSQRDKALAGGWKPGNETVLVFEEPIRSTRPDASSRRETVTGNLFQLPRKGKLMVELPAMVQTFRDKMGTEPVTLYLHPDDMERWGLTNGQEVVVTEAECLLLAAHYKYLSPNSRYVFLV
jgi:hypothetical protein